MKKIIILSLAVLISGGAMAAKKKEVVNKNKPVFTTVLENKISSIKDQRHMLELLYPLLL